MNDKSGFSKGKKHITVCGAGYTRSDISDGYLARAQKAEKIIGDAGPLYVTIDPADWQDGDFNTNLIQVVNPIKPVVWVRKVLSQKKRVPIYYRCLEDGNYNAYMHKSMLPYQNWLAVFDGIAEVRTWEPPEPELEWEYGVWKCKSSNYYVRSIKGCHPKSPICIQGIEYGIKKLLEGKPDKHHPFPSKDVQPAFGVRQLTEGEYLALKHPCDVFSIPWYHPCRDGRLLSDPQLTSSRPDECIKKVIKQLAPATDAVTLPDLETV